MVSAAILGCAGYTGQETLDRVLAHPELEPVALGSDSLLFSFEKRTGQRDAAFVDQSQKWFDALWETITTDLTLS